MAYGSIVQGTVINGMALWLLNMIFPMVNIELGTGMGFIMESLIYGGVLTYLAPQWLSA